MIKKLNLKNKIFLLLPFLLITTSCVKKIEYKNYEILTIQPFYFQSKNFEKIEGLELPTGVSNYAELLPFTAAELTRKSESFSYNSEASLARKEESGEERITKEIFSSFGPNKIILFEGHGSFVPYAEGEIECHSVIWTGNDYDDDIKESDPKYQDYQDFLYVPDIYNETISDLFVDKYCPNISGSLVYLGLCFSGRDSTLAQAFLKKGALAVVGNTHAINGEYSNLMEYSTITNLVEINPKTNSTYTLFESLEISKEKFGRTDKEIAKGVGSEPIIFGNQNFSLSK